VRRTAIAAARSSADPPRLTIAHPCPQCGAPVELEETDRLLACPYCRVRLLLAIDGVPRYLLPAKRAAQEEILFIPYWRIRGTLFTCRRNEMAGEVVHRLLDRTFPAVDWPGLPQSLGVRPQAMKLSHASHETPGRFCRPTVTWDRLLSLSQELPAYPGSEEEDAEAASLPSAFIGETVSLIYLPAFLRDGIYDAILDEKIAPLPPIDPTRESSFESKEGFGIRFLANLCPECGWTLSGTHDSLVVPCRGCSRAWEVKGTALRRVPLGVVHSGMRGGVLLPFWRIKAEVRGLTLRSYADLVRLANLPKVMRDEWEGRELHFWVPAFKINGAQLLRIARAVTISQPQAIADRFPEPAPGAPHPNDPFEPDDPTGPAIHPVTLPAGEADESLKMLLAEVGTPRNTILGRLREIEIKAIESRLVYIPFRAEGGEISNPEIPLAVNRNLLRYGRGL
jgi:hypothetical protein